MRNFIPKMYKTEPITIRVKEDKLRRIDQAAGKAGVSRSEFITQCIDYAMEHMENEPS